MNLSRERIVFQAVLKYLLFLVVIALTITSDKGITRWLGAAGLVLVTLDFNDYFNTVRCSECGKLSCRNPYTDERRWWPHKHSK